MPNALTRPLLILLTLYMVSVSSVAAVCVDQDGDGYGVSIDPSCPFPTAPDCDDTDGTVYPGAAQTCDGINNNCDDTWPWLIDWEKHVIGDVSWGYIGKTSDIDVDGDLDLVFTTYNTDHREGWYENTSGDGSSWVEHTITFGGGSTTGTDTLQPTDLDNDGDPDLITSRFDGKVRWTENADGVGQTWNEHIIDNSFSFNSTATSGDLNGDGTLDVVAGSFGLDQHTSMFRYMNVNGNGLTWQKFGIVPGTSLVTAIEIADMDTDGDADILVSHVQGFAVYENLAGNGEQWSRKTLNTSGGTNIHTADIDGDGDTDALSAGNSGVFWYENTGTCCTTRTISTTTDELKWVWGADVDGDGDDDVLAATNANPWRVAWFENLNGDASSWKEHELDSSGQSSVVGVDITLDGKMDVIGAGNGGPRLYEQVSMEEHDGDGDGLSECAGDCDDGRADCQADCSDDDGDGVCQDGDNCPGISNPDQADSNNNGVGDACDADVVPATSRFGVAMLGLLMLLLLGAVARLTKPAT